VTLRTGGGTTLYSYIFEIKLALIVEDGLDAGCVEIRANIVHLLSNLSTIDGHT